MSGSTGAAATGFHSADGAAQTVLPTMFGAGKVFEKPVGNANGQYHRGRAVGGRYAGGLFARFTFAVIKS
eukprot:gene19431-25259_t